MRHRLGETETWRDRDSERQRLGETEVWRGDPLRRHRLGGETERPGRTDGHTDGRETDVW